ncbi:MAG TPA: extracellular solute-binding protein [Chloroflexota bacterium]|nr:extracellular solute-binding protein [Chloroflexota bacterium]
MSSAVGPALVLTRRRLMAAGGLAVLPVLAACNPGQTSGGPGTEGLKVSAPAEIKWMNRNDQILRDAAAEALEKRFQAENPNIKVALEPVPPGQAYPAVQVAAMAAGTAWDVFETWADIVEGFAERGGVLDLERYTKADLKAEDIKDFYPWQWNAFRLYNMRWGMPKYVNVMTLWVNKDLFEKAGVKLPTKDWNHNDYADAMVRLTKTEGTTISQWGGGIPMWSWDRFWYRVDMWGGHVVDPKDNTRCLLHERPALEALDWARALQWDRRVLAQPLELQRTFDSDSLSTNFYNQRIAIVEDGFYPYTIARNVETKFKFMWMHVPKGPVLRRVLGTSDGFTVWKDTKYPDAAWKLVKWLSGRDFQMVQTEFAGSLPVRYSVLKEWQQIVTKNYPMLADANLEVGPEAMEMGYPQDRQFFKKQVEAKDLIVPVLTKLYREGGTPISVLKELSEQVTALQR